MEWFRGLSLGAQAAVVATLVLVPSLVGVAALRNREAAAERAAQEDERTCVELKAELRGHLQAGRLDVRPRPGPPPRASFFE
jgi:hypothetical protein